MTSLIAPAESAESAVEARSGCTLRVSRRGHAERTYRLTSGKCTIGSSPRCHICLPAVDARPLQCLVTLEVTAATVTRWAAGVLLNGNEFATALLDAGDRLSIGPWEIDFQSIVVAERAPSAANSTHPLRETQDFVPQLPPEQEIELPVERSTVDPFAAVQTAERLPDASPSPRTGRASAETIQIVENAPSRAGAQRQRDCASSQAFADGVLLQLWTANLRARLRCKSLLAALRDCRREIEKKTEQCAAVEHQLAQASSDHESQANHWKATRVTLEGELATLQRELAASNLQRERLTAELASLADQQAQVDADRRQQEALFETHAVLEQQVNDLRRQLAERDNQLQTATSERKSAVEALHVLDQQLRLEQERFEAFVSRGEGRSSELDVVRPASVQELAASTDWRKSQPLVDHAQRFSIQNEPAVEAPAASSEANFETASEWTPFASPSVEPNRSVIEAPSADAEASADWRHDWRDESATPPSITEITPAAGSSHSMNAYEEPEHQSCRPTSGSSQSVHALPSAAEEPKPDFVPVSFIDRYRNLLDDDAVDADFAAGRRSLLDDEYLSPKQAEIHDDPGDDSDEALEAYMSNLMRRMRGDSPNPGPTPAAMSRATALTPGLLASDVVEEAPAPEPQEPAEPFELESIKRAPRRPLNLDLSAMREIANVTARTAIAEHRQRRQVESIISKVIISAMGVAAGAYALFAAPSFDSPWFWAGCLASTTSAGLAVQLAVVLRRRMARRRRHLDPQAANEFHRGPQIQFSDFTTENTESTEVVQRIVS